MAGIPSIDMCGTQSQAFPRRVLRWLAYDGGRVQRRRKVDPVALFWTLVLRYRSMGFGAAICVPLEPSWRKAASMTGSPPGLVQRLKQALGPRAEGDGAVRPEPARGAGGVCPLRYLRSAVGRCTVVRLHRLLARVYPATRTHPTRAAVKRHAGRSVTGAGQQS